MNRTGIAWVRTRIAHLRERPDEGSVSAWFITSAVALIAVVGLVLDGGSQLHATERAYGLAAQAARTGGQQLDTGAVVSGQVFTVDPYAAVAAAENYLAGAGVEGSAWIEGERVHVAVTDSYTPQLLGMLGLGPFPVEATASARLVRVLGGAEG